MLGPFEIAAILLFVGGAVGVGWALLPWLRSQRLEVDPDLVDPAELESDLDDRLTTLLQRSMTDGDAPAPWERRLPMATGRRVAAPFRPSDAVLAVLTEEQAFLLPLDLLHASAPGPDVQRGRSFGRPLHAVRLRDDLYLDLVAAARVLPLFAAELEALTPHRTLEVFDDLDAVLATERIAVVVCPWLIEADQPAAIPEGEGLVTSRFELRGEPLVVEAWMPAVRRGAQASEPTQAARIRWGEAIEAGGLVADARGPLEADDTTFQWTREELMELAAVGHRLEGDGLERELVEAAFVDRAVPVPGDDEAALVAAAVLNWAGVVVRRNGAPLRSLGYFDAGLSIVADPDNRADLLYNRGYARLHAASASLRPTGHERLQTFTFEGVDTDVLEAALRDFTLASGLNPTDPDAWSQIAVVRQLLGNRTAASEAWLQAATRVDDEAVRQRMLANAEALTSDR